MEKIEIVLRSWDEAKGLIESDQQVASVGELFDLLVNSKQADRINRVVVNGFDRDKTPCKVTLEIASITKGR